MTTDEKQKHPIWPCVLIAVGLLLLVAIAILLSTGHTKPRVEIRFAGYSDLKGATGSRALLNGELEGDLKAAFLVTNSASRTVMLYVKWFETNVSGTWYACSTKPVAFSRTSIFFAQGNGEEKIFLTPPEGAHTWRARFIAQTEAKGWEVYWEYAKTCTKNLSHGWALPQYPYPQANTKWFTHPEEVVGPVVSSK